MRLKQLVFLLALLLAAACSHDDSSEELFGKNETAINLVTKFARGLSFTQLEVEWNARNQIVPKTPHAIETGDRFRVLLPDDRAGAPVSIEVWGLTSGARRGHAIVEATPVLHKTIDVELEIVAIAACTDCGCKDECSVGVCSDASYQACGQFDDDPCLELSPVVACAPSDSCNTSSCTPEAGCAATSVTCDAPPASECVGTDTLRTYSAAGSCSGGKCEYVTTDVACPSCPACNACAGVSCNTPPSPCHAAAGTCQNGTCVYPLADGKACDDGNACTQGDACSQGQCAGAAVACNAPPASQCLSSWTLRTYKAAGTCLGGLCGYDIADVLCEGGCKAGACLSLGNCCSGHTSGGCSNSVVQSCVCAQDSYCCNVEWDSVCADLESFGCGIC